MRKFLSLVLTVFFIVNRLVWSHEKWSTSMVSAYFKSKGVHLVDTYLCHSKDAVRLMKDVKHYLDEEYSIFWRVTTKWPTGEVHEKRVGVFFDASCVRNQNLLNESKKIWFDVVFSWLVWDPYNATHIQTNFTDNLSMYSDVVVTSGADFKRVTKFVSEDPVKTSQIGFWNRHDESVEIKSPEIRPNLHRSVIRGVMFAVQDIYSTSNISAQMQDPYFKHGWDSGNRYFYRLALNLAEMYNFTLGLKKTNNWGDKIGNGTWNGIIGELQRGDADLGFTPMVPVPQRLEQSYASPCVQKYWFTIIFKQPRILGTYKALIMELSGTVWALVGVSVLAGAVVFTVTMKYTEAPDASLDLGMVQNIGMLANQGLSVDPRTTSSRIVCFTGMVLGFLVTNYYNVSTLTALLAEAPPAIKNLDDFIDSDIDLYLINASYATRKSEWVKLFRPRLIKRLENRPLRYVDTDEGLNLIREGNAFFAEFYILFDAINKNFTDDEKCSITVFASHLVYTGMRFVRRDKHLLEMVARGLTKTQEHGIVKKERDDWVPGPPICFRSVPFIHVKLESVSVALGIFLVGFALSVVVFVLEMLRGRKPSQRGKKDTISKRGVKGRKEMLNRNAPSLRKFMH